MSSRIGVLEITPESAPRLAAGLSNDSPLHKVVEKVASALAAGGRVFLLEWEGRSVPHGAEILGRTVTFADAACLMAGDTVIGTLQHLVVDGGQTGHFQQRLLFARAGI